MKKKSFIEDLNSPLNEVERNWLRKIATICITILSIPLFLILGFYEAFTKGVIPLFKECWKSSIS